MYIVRTKLFGEELDDLKFFDELPKARAHAAKQVSSRTGDAFIYHVVAEGDPRLAKHQFEMEESELVESRLLPPSAEAARKAHNVYNLKDL